MQSLIERIEKLADGCAILDTGQVIALIKQHERQPVSASVEAGILNLYWEANAAFEHGDDAAHDKLFAEATEKNKEYWFERNRADSPRLPVSVTTIERVATAMAKHVRSWGGPNSHIMEITKSDRELAQVAIAAMQAKITAKE